MQTIIAGNFEDDQIDIECPHCHKRSGWNKDLWAILPENGLYCNICGQKFIQEDLDE